MNVVKISVATLIASASLIVAAAGIAHGADSAPTLIRSGESDSADAPSGRLLLRMPSAGRSDKNGQSGDNGEPPVEPGEPGTEGSDPTFFGEPVGGNLVFVLDVSASMTQADVGAGEDSDGNTVGNMSRLDAVKFETIRMLSSLSEGDAFDFVLLAGTPIDHAGKQTQPITDAWSGSLKKASADNVAAAIAYIKDLATWQGTPTYKSLERATHDYGSEISMLVFLSDGDPHPRQGWDKGDSGRVADDREHVEAVLADFPGWFAPLAKDGDGGDGCAMICVHIGQNPLAGSFMQDLAAQNHATYVHK
ncbi:MAG: hypothetical protein L6Q71_08435 [Planctomycetes bacterium]|nr:hypothetical protein [Planctomycetota bacterium]NUQ33849.1 hypothetical protein [Planctomycetaceae bacterium]